MGVTTDRLSRLRKLAYALAGRAVVCVLRRRGFRSVSLVTEGRTGGRLALVPVMLEDRHSGVPDQTKIEREIVIDLAGPIAVRVANQRDEWRGTGRDLLGAARAIDLAARGTTTHEVQRIVRAT